MISLSAARRGALSAAIILSLALGIAVAATRADARFLPRASVSSCAGHVSPDHHLTGADIGFLRHFLPCVAERARARGIGPFTVSPALTRSADRILHDFERVPLSQARVFLARQMHVVAATFCGAGRGYRYAAPTADNTPPPVLTPQAIIDLWRHVLRGEPLVDRAGTLYAFAEVRHNLFRDPAQPDPVAFIMLGLHCLA